MAQRVTTRPDDQLDMMAVAKLLGVTYKSARTLRSRGDFPPQDGKFGQSPWWFRFTVDTWKQQRAERSA